MALFGWSRTRLAAAAGAGTLLAAGAVGAVYAQTPTATATPKSGQQRADEALNRFAANLGVDSTRVKSALQQTATQYVDEALAAGRLTAEQAQRAKEAINSGQFPGLGFGGFGGFAKVGAGQRGPGGPGGLGRGDGPGRPGAYFVGIAHESLATFLGITPATLRSELQGTSIAQVAQAHGKTVDELKAHITSEAQTRANEAVAKGRLTQDQANTMISGLQSRLDEMVNKVHDQAGPRGDRGGLRVPRPASSATPSGSSS